MFGFRSGMALCESLGRAMGPRDRLKLECELCRRLVALPRGHAFRTFGAGATPWEVRRRAVCGGCGGRKVSVTVERIGEA